MKGSVSMPRSDGRTFLTRCAAGCKSAATRSIDRLRGSRVMSGALVRRCGVLNVFSAVISRLQLSGHTTLNDEFSRIKRLPPYIFNIVGELKAKARAQGEDIIEGGGGNPDKPTPQHNDAMMNEAAQRRDTQRKTVSKG